MAQTTTADGGNQQIEQGVELIGDELGYARPRHGPREADELRAEIETRAVNRYTTVETESESFESTVSSNVERGGALLLWVREDGSYRVADLHSPERGVNSDEHAVEGRHLWHADWDWEIAAGVRQKGVSSRSDTHRNATKKRTKIEREAVDSAAERDERLFVLEYELRDGGQSGSRGNPSKSWRRCEATRAIELVATDE